MANYGNPLRVLVAVTRLPEVDMSAMIGRILPWAADLTLLAGKVHDFLEKYVCWPGLAVCGTVFAAIQF